MIYYGNASLEQTHGIVNTEQDPVDTVWIGIISMWTFHIVLIGITIAIPGLVECIEITVLLFKPQLKFVPRSLTVTNRPRPPGDSAHSKHRIRPNQGDRSNV